VILDEPSLPRDEADAITFGTLLTLRGRAMANRPTVQILQRGVKNTKRLRRSTHFQIFAGQGNCGWPHGGHIAVQFLVARLAELNWLTADVG
jgi:hypothetical protein